MNMYNPILDRLRGGTVAVCTRGLNRLAADIEALLDVRVIYRPSFMAGSAQAIVGWGHKPTANAARLAAVKAGIPYIAFEDGFLRSIRPGSGEPSSSYVIDTQGIYYDAQSPSLLQQLIGSAQQLSPIEWQRADAAIRLLKSHRLSKYNSAPPRDQSDLGLEEGKETVLVVDQTFGDASIAGALADEHAFTRALQAALNENPEAEVIVKVHPETLTGKKRGYLAQQKHDSRVRLISEDIEPALLFERLKRVYVVSSLLGFEGLVAGVPVSCFGSAFYSGWGLTKDHQQEAPHRGQASLTSIFHAAYFEYSRYLDAWTRRPVDFETAVDQLAFLRRRYLENGPSVCLGMTIWKKKSVRRFLDGWGGTPLFARSTSEALAEARKIKGRVVVWASREPKGLAENCQANGIALYRMEDGFLRSVGLGASFVQPASLILDDRGIYYDPSRQSRFEALALETRFSPGLLAQARTLREQIVKARLSKYNEGTAQSVGIPAGKYSVLVPGQVEDDAAIKLGTRNVLTNLDLLKAVRRRHPEAYIIYKPHPDVDAGYRKGKINPETVYQFADIIVTGVAMPSLLDLVDRIETMTSLTGFEALLRRKQVAVHGQPFYAGWGLTEDLDPISRRTRRLSLDQLTALTLIVYPNYVDPISGRPCQVETIVQRLEQTVHQRENMSQKLASKARHVFAWCIHNTILRLTR